MLALAVVVAGCGGAEGIGNPCHDYIACYEHTGGTHGALDATYGAMGTCWVTTEQAARNCENLCWAFLEALKADHPDAGC